MYVYVYIYVCTHPYVYVYIHTTVHMYIFILIDVYMYIQNIYIYSRAASAGGCEIFFGALAWRSYGCYDYGIARASTRCFSW